MGGPRDAPMAVPPGAGASQDVPVARCSRVSWGVTPRRAAGSSRRIPNVGRNETLPSLQPRSWVPWGDGAAQPLGEIWEQLSPQVPPAVAALAGDVKEFDCVSDLLKAV